jgi:hypothetical protein
MNLFIAVIFFAVLSLCGESEKERLSREKEELIKIELENENKIRREALLAKERAEREKIEAKEREIYNRYINNSLTTGTTPYSQYYGNNSSCFDYGCSEIKVRTSNSDVLVTIKKNNKVVRHAFIKAGDGYTFSLPNGEYQTFFYYGKGWNPNQKMKGGFINNEVFGKDEPQRLYNNILEYQLILQQNGSFSTKPSNPDEAL